MEYRADGEIAHRIDVGEALAFEFVAQRWRRERGKPYASVAVYCLTPEFQQLLEEDDIALPKREERVRLGNSAWEALPGATAGVRSAGKADGIAKAYPPARLQADLLHFCRDLWPFATELDTPESLSGADAQPPEFLIHPYVQRKGGTILFAPPGRGKSFTGLLWAYTVQYGLTNLWHTQHGNVLYVNLERSPESIAWRLACMSRALGLPEQDSPLYLLNRKGKALDDVLPAIQRWVEREQTDLVIVDSLSRVGVGDLNENRPANTAMDMLNGLPCAWVALAHTPRNDPSHVYGSVMFDAAADALVELATEEQRSQQRLGIGLKVVKGNDVPLTEREVLAYEFVVDGLIHVRGAEPGEFPELGLDNRERSTVDLILEHLEVEGRDFGAHIATAIGRAESSVSNALTTNPHLFERQQDAGTKRAYWSVRPL